ncbi:MAG TPA: response regulator [Bacteroidia bacterium]|nr:response regulator [Bacteroidia bacterium]
MEKLQNKSILIVDDDDRNTFALVSYLETLGVKITVAGNGREALTMLEEGLESDLILLDMMMPVMDGYETLDFMRQNSMLDRFPVIAVTARAMKGDREKCLEAGASDYISKPVDMRLLIEKMNRWIH